jgi:aspartokinase/homoserine dehydrogenase 1
MLVVKFGGTSLGTVDALSRVIALLKDPEHAGAVRVVVASAFSGMTDDLIDLAYRARAEDPTYGHALAAMRERHDGIADGFLTGAERKRAKAETEKTFAELIRTLDGVSILQELSPRILDGIMSFGERLSASLIAAIFSGSGIPAKYLDSRKLIKTDRQHGNARFLAEETFENIASFFHSAPSSFLYVASGFIGSTLQGVTTTLGRGGSDLSASIFGAALRADEVEIWTDVDGIMTADPKLVKNAFRIDEISYIEAMELSHFGAKVLYTPTIKPALKKGIPIYIRNTFNPRAGGTRVTENARESPYAIRGISSMPHVAVIRIQGSGMVGVSGFSSRLFSALGRRGINIVLITQSSSEYSICFAVLPEDTERAVTAVHEEFYREIGAGAIEEPFAESDMAVVAVVGARMKKTAGIAGRVFHALGRNGINVAAIAQGSSELNISAVIARRDEAKAVNAVHEAFFLAGMRSVNLFLLGTGLIGGTMLDQIAEHREVLARDHQVRINVIGAANSRSMLFDAEGLDPKEAKTLLKNAKTPDAPFDLAAFKECMANAGNAERLGLEPFDLSLFIEKMQSLNLPNSAFCDCTADDAVSARYAEILEGAIPIVTPNKRANSGALSYYRKIVNYAKERGIPYLYEVTVCAGLPVISTLRDLFLSGDKVRRIEAVLSGTLSYIFNNYDGTVPFSALVRQAKEKGYTEPDPRDDLNAMDAARKALILARECGMPLEFSAVAVEPLLPAACFDAPSVEEFFTELEKADADFEARRARAAAEGKALRYVAVIEEGAVRLSLRAEGAESPFRSLVDADNMVVITSQRYSTLPMVIKGPGAGAQVTAGGVLADILRIAKTLV